MSTFATMKARIVSETLRDDLTPTQLGSAINDAVKQFEADRYAFNERRYRINTVAAQEYYDLTSPTLLTFAGAAVGAGETLLELDDISCTISGQSYRLCPRTQQQLNEWETSTYQGRPMDYGLYGQQLRLFPVPDAVYQLNLSGLARLSPNPLSADADTNAWMTEAEPMIRNGAKMLIYRDVLRDLEGASQAVEATRDAQGMLKRKMAAQAYTGRQRASSL